MAKINIVLHEPEIPQNTGNIARTCAATGAALHLIRPLGFEIDDKKLKRAGLDYWHQGVSIYYFSTKAPRAYTEVTYEDEVYLMFGKETKGLPETLLAANKERCVRIPMRDGLRSLNLSNSAAIAVYEVLRQREFSGLREDGELTTCRWEDTE